MAASPLPSGRASQRSPSPPQCPVKTGSTDEDIASIVALLENRQPLLGTERHASSRPSKSVTIERQLELCGKPCAWASPGGESQARWNWQVKSKTLASGD